MSVMVIDAGNSLIKFKRGDGKEDEFPHALVELSPTEVQQIAVRSSGRVPEGYAIVNGVPYAYGEQAEHYGTRLVHRHGAERYTADYYGVFVAIALGQLFSKDSDISVFGSHAPGDIDFRDELMQSAAHRWTVEILDRRPTFTVGYINTFDEPQGGLMNVVLADDGQHYRRSDINGGRALVIDIGGRTTDYLAVSPGGEVDYSLQTSTQMGILDVIQDFERTFRAHHKDRLRALPKLPPDRIRNAIAKGVFVGGGDELRCENEVEKASGALLNRISSTYRDVAGGPLQWDSIILTGGGAAMLYDRLLPILDHKHILLADEPAKIHLANVRGGLKLWKFYKSEGLVE